jgi:small subunit ribosomal protein S18
MAKRRHKKRCWFEVHETEPNYRNLAVIKRFVSERGKIVPRRLSGVSAKNQRKLAREIKRARHLALIPFVAENMR